MVSLAYCALTRTAYQETFFQFTYGFVVGRRLGNSVDFKLRKEMLVVGSWPWIMIVPASSRRPLRGFS